MSKVAVKGNESGTGVFTIAAPNSNTDRTFNLPDEQGTVLTDVSDIEPQVKTSLNATGSAPIYACRAWVNFNGGGTVAIRESGNVSSITDNGTGDYTVNFTTAMPDANYAAQSMSSGSNLANGGTSVMTFAATSGLTTSSVRIFAKLTSSVGGVDRQDITLAIFR